MSLQKAFLELTELMLCNIQTSAYILKTVRCTFLQTKSCNGEIYAQEAMKCVINFRTFEKGKKKDKCINLYFASYHCNGNVNNPRIPEKRRLSKNGV